jgi:hypothetical protein
MAGAVECRDSRLVLVHDAEVTASPRDLFAGTD